MKFVQVVLFHEIPGRSSPWQLYTNPNMGTSFQERRDQQVDLSKNTSTPFKGLTMLQLVLLYSCSLAEI